MRLNTDITHIPGDIPRARHSLRPRPPSTSIVMEHHEEAGFLPQGIGSPPPYTPHDPTATPPAPSSHTDAAHQQPGSDTSVNDRWSILQPGLVNIAGANLSEPIVRLAKKESLTILLVGETGVGKTSFLSLLVNLFSGRGPGQFALFHNPANESNLSRSQSQTNDAFMYQFTTSDGVHIRILDTPGLADTRGLDQDEAHKASIVRAIGEQVKTIDSVVVLANGTQERLGVATEYALSAIGSMFPRSIAGNIAFMFTHVADPLSMNFSSSSLPSGFTSANMWTIQNPIAQFVKYKEYISADTTQVQQEHLWNVLLRNYDQTVCTLTAFLKRVDACKAQPTKAIQELFDMTMAIESKLVNIFARISQQEERRVELSRLKAELRTSHLIMEINKKFESIMTRQIMAQNDTPKHNTICTFKHCYSNCHLNCDLDFFLDPNEIGKRCSVFQDYGPAECSECGHSSDYHRHYHSMWAANTEQETVQDNQAKTEYDRAKSQVVTLQTQTQAIEDALHQMDRDIMDAENQIGALCVKFGDCALTGSFAGHLDAAIRTLTLRYESMKSSADAEFLARMVESIDHLQKKLAVVRRASLAESGSSSGNRRDDSNNRHTPQRASRSRTLLAALSSWTLGGK